MSLPTDLNSAHDHRPHPDGDADNSVGLDYEFQGQAESIHEEERDENYQTPPPDKILNIREFLDNVDNGIVFTRELLYNAARQLQLARQGKDVELVDRYGIRTTFATKDSIEAG